jgi:hypothetical protein
MGGWSAKAVGDRTVLRLNQWVRASWRSFEEGSAWCRPTRAC